MSRRTLRGGGGSTGTSVAFLYALHGSTASTVRPTSSGPVYWIGSVTPTNAVQGDVWQDTSTTPATEKVRGASAFSVLGVTQAQAIGYAIVFGGN